MLTFIRSSGCVQQAAIALAIPPKYHLPILFVLSTDMTDINYKIMQAMKQELNFD
jgi:hypothetical protein